MTVPENNKHAFDTGLSTIDFADCSGNKNVRSKLNIDKINQIFNDRLNGISYQKLAIKFQVSFSQIAKICARTRWTHIKQNENGEWYEP